MSQVYIRKDGNRLGPFSLDKVNEKLELGEFSPLDIGWMEGMDGWKPLSDSAFLTAGIKLAAPDEGAEPSTEGETKPFKPDPSGASALSPTAPDKPTKGKRTKEINEMNGLSSKTNKALYLILAGLMARPLMDAISSLMDSSNISGFLEHIGNLGAIGCSGLGVIMLLSDCLKPKEGETGTDAATTMLLRVAMVFVIVIMLVVLMQLVGEVKLPDQSAGSAQSAG